MGTGPLGPLPNRPLANQPPKNLGPGQVGPQVKKITYNAKKSTFIALNPHYMTDSKTDTYFVCTVNQVSMF